MWTVKVNSRLVLTPTSDATRRRSEVNCCLFCAAEPLRSAINQAHKSTGDGGGGGGDAVITSSGRRQGGGWGLSSAAAVLPAAAAEGRSATNTPPLPGTGERPVSPLAAQKPSWLGTGVRDR